MSFQGTEKPIDVRNLSTPTLNPPAIVVRLNADGKPENVSISSSFVQEDFGIELQAQLQALNLLYHEANSRAETLNQENATLKDLLHIYESHHEPIVDFDIYQAFSKAADTSMKVKGAWESVGKVKSTPFEIDFED